MEKGAAVVTEADMRTSVDEEDKVVAHERTNVEKEVEEVVARGPAPKPARRPLKEKNLNVAPEDFLKDTESDNTKSSTKTAVKLYNDTMKAAAEAEKTAFIDLKNTPVENLPGQLSKFLMVVTKLDGKPMGAGSLHTYFSSLARYISREFQPSLDIRKDPRFKVVLDTLRAAQKESAKAGETAGKYRSEPIQDHHIALLWEKKKFGREDPKALITTVHSLLTTVMGFRANTEVYNLRNEDVVFSSTLTKNGLPEKIEVSERVTKTRQGGKGEVRDLRPAVCPDTVNLDICPVRTLLEYQQRKPLEMRKPEEPFMLAIKQSALERPQEHEHWFTRSRMGVGRIGKLLPEAMKEVGIDCKKERYTNRSGRKTLMEAGVEAAVPGVLVSKVAGHNDLNSIKNYYKGGKNAHNAASVVLARKIGGKKKSNFEDVYKELEESRREEREQGEVGAENRLVDDEKIDEDGGFPEFTEYDDGVSMSQSRLSEVRKSYGGGGRVVEERRRLVTSQLRRQDSSERRWPACSERRPEMSEGWQQASSERQEVSAERQLVCTERKGVTALLREVTGVVREVAAVTKHQAPLQTLLALQLAPQLTPQLMPQLAQNLWTTARPAAPALSQLLGGREPTASDTSTWETDLVRREESLRMEKQEFERSKLQWKEEENRRLMVPVGAAEKESVAAQTSAMGDESKKKMVPGKIRVEEELGEEPEEELGREVGEELGEELEMDRREERIREESRRLNSSDAREARLRHR